MDICSKDHDEVCYEGRDCPVCKLREWLQDEIDGLVEDIEDKNSKIDNLNKEIERLNNLE